MGQISASTTQSGGFNVVFRPGPVINVLDQPALGFEYTRSRRPVRVPIEESGAFGVTATLNLTAAVDPYLTGLRPGRARPCRAMACRAIRIRAGRPW